MAALEVISLCGYACMLVAFEHRNKYAVLCGIYAAISFLLGAVFIGGTSVDVNALFDADIALSLAAGLIVNHLSKNWITAWVVVAAVYVFPVALGLRQVEADEELNLSHWINPLNDERQVASRDIAFSSRTARSGFVRNPSALLLGQKRS